MEVRFVLYDYLGISSYLRDDQCNISSEDLTPLSGMEYRFILFDDLGISSYLRDDQCNISSEDFTPHYQGWKSGLYFMMTLVFLVI
jgi:hypothetical protein